MELKDLLVRQPAGKRMIIAVPFAHDPDIIKCIGQALKRGLAHFILIGRKQRISQAAKKYGVDLRQATYIFEQDEQTACNRAAALIKEKRAQVLMKGLVQTSSFLRAILHKEYDLIPPGSLISCVACFAIPGYGKLLFLTDPAVNIMPSLEAKVQILHNAIRVARRLGVACPRVACVEPTEKVNSKIPSTIDASELERIGQSGVFGKAVVEGPLGFDVAIARKAARIKGVASKVSGKADILMMPQLVSANVLYKSFVWNSRAEVASIVAGARAPIVLPSRSDSDKAKLYSIGLAVFLASRNRRGITNRNLAD